MLNNLFLRPLRQYLETIEQIHSSVVRCTETETMQLCLSKKPIAVMNIWETLIEAQRNKEFSKFMLTMGKTEDDFRGEITGWNIYKHENYLYMQQGLGKDVENISRGSILMPETKENVNGRPKETLGKYNPYRCFKTSHASVSRTMRMLEQLDIEFVYSIVPTFPKEVSALFIETSIPAKITSRLNKCFKEFSSILQIIFAKKLGIETCKLAMCENTHVWSSMMPSNPHGHAHILLLDKLILPDTSTQIIPTWFMEKNERTHKYEETLLTKLIKQSWAAIVNKEFGTQYKTLDIKLEFIELKKEDGSENVAGHRKLIHKLKYNRRRPIADLALFYLFNDFDLNTIDNEFAEYLIEYQNRTLCFGYWNRMSNYIDLETALENSIINVDKETRCPFCYQRLVYDSFREGKELPKDAIKVFIDRKGIAWRISGDG